MTTAEDFYFERRSGGTFVATELTSGAWNPAEQHVAPSLGLLAHEVERDLGERRDDHLRLTRVSFDILGTYPVGEVDVGVRVARPGRTIELVEATLSANGRAVVVLRAWLQATYDSAAITGGGDAPFPDRAGLGPGSLGIEWAGRFVKSVDVAQEPMGPGRGRSWVRARARLVKGEESSPTARLIGVLDVANGLTPRVGMDVAAYPNLDLVAHLYREPEDGWTGLDTTVSFAADGVGLTRSVVHDDAGLVGTCAQILTVRPR
ncbi:MAG: thioesterase family protein [Actinomycetaceae bacterium]